MRKFFLLLFFLPLMTLNANNSPLLVHSTQFIRVYNLQPEGFVIVSTDRATPEILGFSDHGAFDSDSIPDALADLLISYENEIQRFGSHVERPFFDFARLDAAPDNIIVAPLIKTKWAQGTYYNSKCPADSNGQGGHAQVGCGAVVMGQVMRYWLHPEHGAGSHSYVCNFAAYGYGNYGTLSADFENTYYDYEHMPSKLTASSTEQEVDAVSTLLFHCGVACNMAYGPSASTAQSGNIVSALKKYFRFQNTVRYVEKSQYSSASDWHSLLQSELNDSAPFFYGASGSRGGHVFICDGYGEKDSETYYHLNWGWGGNYDGWFKISDFTPGPYDFNDNHAAIVGIRGDHLPPSAVVDVVDSPQDSSTKVEKIFIDGHIYVKVEDRLFTLMGQPVK